MLQKVDLQSQCLNHLYMGNCLEPKNCKKSHFDFKPQTKKKLQYNVKQEFVPNNSIFTTIQSSHVPQPKLLNEPRVCDCCKGFPMVCKVTEICSSLGRCFCIAQSQVEEMINIEGPKETDCQCCKGQIYSCQGIMCQQLGMCQCQMHKDIEGIQGGNDFDDLDNDAEYFLPEYSDCPCCGGYVLSCGGLECFNGCFCLL
jgi:hypothetical protein